MCFPASCRPAGDTRRPFHEVVDDETLLVTIACNLNVLVLVGFTYSRIESELFLVHPEIPQYRRDELKSVFVDIDR